ncbi:MAG: tRNA 2-thiouridine(34) synthase MnmA [Mycoplasmoidaceae bacterium]
MNMMKKKTVVLGLSGGVDSAVSCYLLLKQGYKVIPVFMQNWDTVINNDIKGHNKKLPDGCESNVDYLAAKKVADFFKLKLHKVEFIKEYWDDVFKYFITQYKKSLTPNPDVLCNKYIKFEAFRKYALNKFKADYLATGHYAALKQNKNGTFLLMPKDLTKDQTYFLSDLNQKQLANVIFPLANFTKVEVRQLAKKIKLPNWDRKDSMGICFIGKRQFQEFLGNYIPNQPGKIVDISNKKVVGSHVGTMYYTLGQNKDLHLSGQANKYFVCGKDVKKKIIYVCAQADKEKYLLSTKCELGPFNFINPTSSKSLSNLKVRFRHLQKLIKVKTLKKINGKWILTYDKTLSVTPGQYAVIYKNKICLGCGEIRKIIK